MGIRWLVVRAGSLRGLVRQLSIDQFENEGRRVSMGPDSVGRADGPSTPFLDRSTSSDTSVHKVGLVSSLAQGPYIGIDGCGFSYCCTLEHKPIFCGSCVLASCDRWIVVELQGKGVCLAQRGHCFSWSLIARPASPASAYRSSSSSSSSSIAAVRGCC